MEKIEQILLTIVYFIVIVFIINKLINLLLPCGVGELQL